MIALQTSGCNHQFDKPIYYADVKVPAILYDRCDVVCGTSAHVERAVLLWPGNLFFGG